MWGILRRGFQSVPVPVPQRTLKVTHTIASIFNAGSQHSFIIDYNSYVLTVDSPQVVKDLCLLFESLLGPFYFGEMMRGQSKSTSLSGYPEELWQLMHVAH